MTAKFSDQGTSRREILRRGGAGLVTGVTALSGCSGLPPLGTRVRYGTVEAPAAGDPAYREWLPAPSALPDDGESGEPYKVMTYAPGHGSAGPRTGGIARSVMSSYADYVGLHIDDADVAFVGDDVVVLLGDVDAAAVRDVIDRTGYERDGSYGGYDLYSRDDVRRVVGVGRSSLAFGRGDRAVDRLAAFVDAREGNVSRYVEESEDFGQLIDSAGLRRWNWLNDGNLVSGMVDESLGEDVVGWATSFDVDEQALYFVQTWIFPEGYDLTEARVKDGLKEDGRVVRAAAVDVEVTGRVATIEMRLAREKAAEEFSEFSAAPFATWGVTRDRDAERLTFHHEAGDAIPVDRLSVNPWGEERTTDFDGVGDQVEPGDALSISTSDVPDDTEVRLVWKSASGDATSTIFSYGLP